MTRGTKWLLAVLALPLILLLLAAVLIPLFIDQKTVLSMAADAVRRETGAELTVDGDASFSVFPRLGLQLGEVALLMPDQVEPLFSARELALALQLGPLFSGEVAVDGLELVGLQLTLQAEAQELAQPTPSLSDQELDAYYTERRRQLELAREQALEQAGKAVAAPLALNVARLRVVDSQVILVAADGSRTLLEIATLEASELNLEGRPIPLDLAMRVVPAPAQAAIDIKLSGRVGVDGQSRKIGVEALRLEAQHPELQTLVINTSGALDSVEQVADLMLKLEYGDLLAEGKLAYSAYGSPQIDAQLDVNVLDPLLLLLLGPQAAAEADSADSGDDALPLAALRDIDTRARLSVARAAFQGHNVQDLQLVLRARDGVLEIDTLTARVHDGQLNMQARFDASHNVAGLSGSGTLSAVDLESVTSALATGSPLSGRLDLNWRIDSAGATVNQLLEAVVADLELQLAGDDLSGGGTVLYAPGKSPQVDARLQLNRFDPALLALAGPDAGAQAAEQPAPGESSGSDELPLEVIRQIDSKAELAVGQAVFGAHTIDDLLLRIRAVDGVVKVNKLEGQLHGGTLNLKATLDANEDRAKLWSKGTFNDLDVARALAAAEVEPVVTGKASLDWTINTSGNGVDAWISGLGGPLKLTTQDIVLTNLGIQKLLCESVALVNQERLSVQLPQQTEFETVAVDVQLRKGVAHVDPLRATLPYIQLGGSGQLDLARQDFSATVAAVLSPEIRTVDPACRVNERLAAIEWPVACKGNLSGEPGDWCSVDTGKIIEAAVRNEAQRAIQKEAGKLFEKLFEKK